MLNDGGYVDAAELMREWIELGDGEENNAYIRFMAYWVAFNMLYEDYKRNRSEFGAIWACFRNFESQFRQYDPFRNGDVGIFKDDAVKQLFKSEGEHESNRRKDDPEEELGLIRSGNRRALLYAVYRVRCNFFHGNKRLGDPTDREFVTTAAIIIRGYLGALYLLPDAK